MGAGGRILARGLSKQGTGRLGQLVLGILFLRIVQGMVVMAECLYQITLHRRKPYPYEVFCLLYTE